MARFLTPVKKSTASFPTCSPWSDQGDNFNQLPQAKCWRTSFLRAQRSRLSWTKYGKPLHSISSPRGCRMLFWELDQILWLDIKQTSSMVLLMLTNLIIYFVMGITVDCHWESI